MLMKINASLLLSKVNCVKTFRIFHFSIEVIFKDSLISRQNWASTEGSPLPSPPYMHSLPHYQCSPQEWYICYKCKMYIDTSSPKVLSLHEVHSWCCTSYGFGQMYNIYPPLQYYTKEFHGPKNPQCSTYSSFPPQTPDNHGSFYCVQSFAFSRISYSWNHTVCSLFRLASFTW